MIWKWFRDGGSAAVPAAAALYLCGGCAEPPVPTTIAISPASAPLHSIGETMQLTATVEDQYGQAMTGTAIAWSSGDASVAGVDAAGLVTAVDNGVATVTASAGAESGTAEVTVEQRVAVILVLPEAFTLIRRGSVRASAEAEDANGHPIPAAPFAWHSDDSTVATVDEAGLVSGVGVGTASAIASSGGVEAGSDISVVVPPPVRSMELRSVPTNGGIPSGGGSWELPPDEVFTVVLTGTGNSGYDFVA